MTNRNRTIITRPVERDDATTLCELLNEIIHVGGTTAMESPLTDEVFANTFIETPTLICCHVAIDEAGLLVGFQSLERDPDLPANWGDIGTFTRITPKCPGVGTALFSTTKAYAENAKMAALNATIRADNTGGLAYYEKMGFRTYAVTPRVPLHSGTKVDRISKQLLLSA